MTKILEDYSLVNNIKNNNNNGRKSPRCDEIDIRSPLASRRRFVSSPKTLSPLSIRKSSLPESFEEHVAPDALYIGGGDLLSARLSPVVGLKRRVDNLPGCDSRRSSGSSSIPEVITIRRIAHKEGVNTQYKDDKNFRRLFTCQQY